MSKSRVEATLRFFRKVSEPDSNRTLLDESEYWFLGVNYRPRDAGAEIERVDLRDLYRLDVAAMPTINFDAALQIQWHVEDMTEVDQTKRDFVSDLTEEFSDQWMDHVSSKTERFSGIFEDIERGLDEPIEVSEMRFERS